MMNGKLCHGTGIIPGNQHIGGYHHGKTVKRPLTQNIRQGLTGEKPINPMADPKAQSLLCFTVPIHQKLLLCPTGQRADKFSGSHTGVLGVLRFQEPLPCLQI